MKTISKDLINQVKKLEQAVSKLEKIHLVKMSKKDCMNLIDKIEDEKLYTLKKDIFDPDRVRKTEDDKSAKYYVGYLGKEETPENVTAIIVVNFDRPKSGFIYINELVGVKKGYGFKTLKEFNTKFRNNKVWLMVSPKYDKDTDTYTENDKLNRAYKKNMTDMKEVHLSDVQLTPKTKCGVSWFYTPNCENVIVDMIKSGNYYGLD